MLSEWNSFEGRGLIVRHYGKLLTQSKPNFWLATDQSTGILVHLAILSLGFHTTNSQILVLWKLSYQ